MLSAAPGRGGGRLQSGRNAPFHLKSVQIGDSVRITYTFSNLVIFCFKMTERDALAACDMAGPGQKPRAPHSRACPGSAAGAWLGQGLRERVAPPFPQSDQGVA